METRSDSFSNNASPFNYSDRNCSTSSRRHRDPLPAAWQRVSAERRFDVRSRRDRDSRRDDELEKPKATSTA